MLSDSMNTRIINILTRTQALKKKYRTSCEEGCVVCERDRDAQSLKVYINWYASMWFRNGPSKDTERYIMVPELPDWLKLMVNKDGRTVVHQEELRKFEALADDPEPELTPFIEQLFEILSAESVSKQVFLAILFSEGHSIPQKCNLSWSNIFNAVIRAL